MTFFVIEHLIDVVFMIDIYMNFKFAYLNDQFEIVDDRKEIKRTYLRSWFIIDLLAVFPFAILILIAQKMSGKSLSQLGKFPKMIKLCRLLRILKIIKEKDNVIKMIRDVFKLEHPSDTLFLFVLMFMTLIHICACLWVYIANFAAEDQTDWITANDF
jgi:hypothetical protein